MNKRIEKKKLMNSHLIRQARSEIILLNAIHALKRAEVEANGCISKGYTRWRTYLKVAGIRKRDCSIWREHL